MLKNKLFSLIYFSIIFFILSYLIYIDFHLYQRKFAEFYNTYYIILGILFLFALITLFLKKKINQNIFIICCGLIIPLYVIEIFLNFMPIKKKIIEYSSTTIKHNKYSMSDQNYIDSNYFYNNSENKKYFPLSGIANLKTIYCNENGYWANYLSDRYGFNNPDKVWDHTRLDFVLLGDSFTQGACVNYNDSFAGNLYKKNYKVLSLGNSGNGPLRSYATFKEYTNNFKIKKTIWFYFSGNDLKDLKKSLEHEILSEYYLDKNFSQNLIKNLSEIENAKINFLNKIHKNNKEKKLSKIRKKVDLEEDIKTINKIDTFLGTIKLRKIRNLIPNIPLNFFSVPDTKSLELFSKILDRANNLAKESGSEFYFVYLPSKNRYTGFHYIFLEKYFIKKNIKKLNIIFIDIDKSLFKKIDNPESYYTGHLNKKGYEIVMNKVLQIIDNKKK